MRSRTLAGAALLTALLLNAFPLYQAVTSGGLLYYTNAYDESSYLQYEFARSSLSPSRLGEYVVVLFHHLGLSGGWINLTLDLATFAAFLVVLRKIFLELKFSESQANGAAFLATLLPFLFGGLNPVVSAAFRHNLSSGWVAWVTIPEASFLPLMRSPEPQVSLIVMLLGIFWSLRIRSFLPAYACLPILYTFLVVPFAFIVVALHLSHRFPPRSPGAAVLAPLASFALLAAGLTLYFSLLIDPGLKEYLLHSHLPLLSFSSTAALALCLLLYRWIRPDLRRAALIIALSPLVAANLQLVTGWIAQPNNFEQNFGVCCAAVPCVLALISLPRAAAPRVLAFALCLMCAGLSSYHTFTNNQRRSSRLELRPELLSRLKSDSRHVAINDTEVASVLAMVFPRQPPTFFGYERTSTLLSKSPVAEYLCAKQQINRDAALGRAFRATFARLDSAYRYGNKDFILRTLKRESGFAVLHDTEAVPPDCPPANLHYFLVAAPAR